MLTCYIDESGCAGKLPSIYSSIQPLLVVVGVAFDSSAIATLTKQFTKLVQRYRYGESRPSTLCSDLACELVKGHELRRGVRDDWDAAAKRELPFLDSVMHLLRSHDAKVYGTVLVKAPAVPLDGRRAYGLAMHSIARAFHATLEQEQVHGNVIADFREPKLNGRVCEELMLAKHGPHGDQLPRLLHAPTFGNSETHAALQIADLLCSALVWPLAADKLELAAMGSPHAHRQTDALVRRRYGRLLNQLAPESTAPLDHLEGHTMVPLAGLLDGSFRQRTSGFQLTRP